MSWTPTEIGIGVYSACQVTSILFLGVVLGHELCPCGRETNLVCACGVNCRTLSLSKYAYNTPISILISIVLPVVAVVIGYGYARFFYHKKNCLVHLMHNV